MNKHGRPVLHAERGEEAFVDFNKRQRQDGETLALAGKCIGSVGLGFCLLHSRKAIPVWASDGARRPLPTFYSFHPFFMASAKTQAVERSTNKPVQAFRMRGISLAVFANEVETDDGRFTHHDVSVQRRYRDGDEYKTTTVFRRDDLPILRLLAERAWEYIVTREAHYGKDDEDAE